MPAGLTSQQFQELDESGLPTIGESLYLGTVQGPFSDKAIVGSSGTVLTPDFSKGLHHEIDLTGNANVNAPSKNPNRPCLVMVTAKQSSGGSNTITWNSIFKGTIPALTVGVNKFDHFEFWWNNTAYLFRSAMQNHDS